MNATEVEAITLNALARDDSVTTMSLAADVPLKSLARRAS